MVIHKRKYSPNFLASRTSMSTLFFQVYFCFYILGIIKSGYHVLGLLVNSDVSRVETRGGVGSS